MHTVQSIEQVDVIFPTGERPLLVHCNDLEYYVCKYNKTGGASNLLFREYMAASFLKFWQLQAPDFSLVTLQPHHNPASIFNIKNDVPCFGSLRNREYREVDAFIERCYEYTKTEVCK